MTNPATNPATHAPDMSELQRRVEAIQLRFSGSARESHERGERLVGLIEAMEQGFARNQRDIEALTRELALANDENRQLRSMLHTLLAVTDNSDPRGIGAAMRELESQINRLVDTASSISGTLGKAPTEAEINGVAPTAAGAAEEAAAAE